MSDKNSAQRELEDAKRVAEELLYLVLDHVGKPVVLDIDEAKSRMTGDKMIDLNFDTEAGTVTLQIVEVPTRVE